MHVDKNDITLSGIIINGEWPVLDGEMKLNDGVISTGSGFTVENLKVVNYKGNGVMTQAANNVTIRRLIVEHTGIYGIYPTLGDNVIIEDTITVGIEDAGIYVGQCAHTEVRRNILYENVAGIEIENSTDVIVEGNTVYNNTSGILVFALPGLPKKKTENVAIRGNTIYNNNHPNFGAPGSIVANTPPGAGIILLAADKVTIEDNLIYDNELAGIIVADLGVMPSATPDPEVEPNPDDTPIMRNVLRNNGKNGLGFLITWYRFIGRNLIHGGSPQGTVEDLLPRGADIVGTGKGQRNCILDRDAFTLRDADYMGRCVEAQSVRALTSVQSVGVGVAKMETGQDVYTAVCSGCHAYSFRLIGPPVSEIQQKYAGKSEEFAAYAMAPTKVRDNFPEMPPQAHLGKGKLGLVAQYMLEMTK